MCEQALRYVVHVVSVALVVLLRVARECEESDCSHLIANGKNRFSREFADLHYFIVCGVLLSYFCERRILSEALSQPLKIEVNGLLENFLSGFYLE